MSGNVLLYLQRIIGNRFVMQTFSFYLQPISFHQQQYKKLCTNKKANQYSKRQVYFFHDSSPVLKSSGVSIFVPTICKSHLSPICFTVCFIGFPRIILGLSLLLNSRTVMMLSLSVQPVTSTSHSFFWIPLQNKSFLAIMIFGS